MTLAARAMVILLCASAFSCGNQQLRLRLFVPRGPIARGLVEHRPCPKDYENCVDIVPLGYEELYKQAAADLLEEKHANSDEKADLYLLDDAWVPQFRDDLISFDLPATHSEFQEATKVHWTDGSSYWAVPLLTNLQMLFQKGTNSKTCSWAEIAKVTSASGGRSPSFVLRGRFAYALTNDFLPILWANGADLVVNGKSASFVPESGARAAIHALHELARQGPPYQELLSTDGLRLELGQNPAVIAIEWSASAHQLSVPDVTWSAMPCLKLPIHTDTGSPECEEAGVLSTWVLGAPKRLKGKKRDAVSALFRGLMDPASTGELCALDASLTSPPVPASCPDTLSLDYYASGLFRSGLAWSQAGIKRRLVGRLRPSTPYWHEIDQRIGRSLNNVLLDLQSEEQTFTNLKTELLDLQPR